MTTRAATALALLALLAAAPALAHPEGRATFQTVEVEGVAVHFAAVANVTMATRPAALHVELREAASAALVEDANASLSLVPPGGGAARDVPLVAEGPGRLVARWTPDAVGEWRARVALDGAAGAEFSCRVFPYRSAWVDFTPAALARPVAGEPLSLEVEVRDEATGEVLAAPRDAVLRIGHRGADESPPSAWLDVPLAPTGEPGRLSGRATFPASGGFDVVVVAPSLGLAHDDQPPFDVHVTDPLPTPEGPREVPLTGAGLLALALAALLRPTRTRPTVAYILW